MNSNLRLFSIFFTISFKLLKNQNSYNASMTQFGSAGKLQFATIQPCLEVMKAIICNPLPLKSYFGSLDCYFGIRGTGVLSGGLSCKGRSETTCGRMWDSFSFELLASWPVQNTKGQEIIRVPRVYCVIGFFNIRYQLPDYNSFTVTLSWFSLYHYVFIKI